MKQTYFLQQTIMLTERLSDSSRVITLLFLTDIDLWLNFTVSTYHYE